MAVMRAYMHCVLARGESTPRNLGAVKMKIKVLKLFYSFSFCAKRISRSISESEMRVEG